MSKPKSPVTLNESILEEASGWFIDFNEGELDAAAREQFHQWLRRSPEHVRAYIEIAAAWEDSSRLNPPQTLDIDALIAQASAEHNIIPLSSHARRGGESGRTPTQGEVPNSTRRMRFAVAAAVLLAVIGASAWYGHALLIPTYATEIGEQRSITLADGSSVQLNSRSRLKVRFTDGERTVELLEGQALFSVAKNPARPFVVYSGPTRVRAVGTQFDVYRKPNGTTITVIEGRVAATLEQREGEAVSQEAGARAEVFLVAGEQFTVTPRSASQPIRANLATATAWTERKLIFDETPLMEVVAEFNRYNTRQLIIQDPALAEFHIRGNFQAAEPDRFVQFLRERFGVRVSERGEEIHISRN